MKYIAIFLVLLCCFMGAASAAEDVSTDLSDSLDSVDDDVTVDAVSEDSSDSVQTESITDPSDDTTEEEIIDETNDVEQTDDSANVESQTRATSVDAYDWTYLKYYGSSTTNYEINLKNPITVDSTILTFGNSATIIGTPSNYITGGSSSQIPFQSTGSLDITFINVTFKDMSASVLMKLATSGHNRIINCTFDNIHTYAFQSSVIWNNGGWMTITGSNFTNCNNSFGAITNHKTYNTVFMNVENCRFENNIGRYEPGAINNCGILNVTDSTFINNRAGQWAGAIHTHSNAYTRIVGSNFTDNVAGTNGGALFSYSKLEVINSTFTGNNATNNGGAICGYSYGSVYNITVDSCNFIKNRVSSGAGGAIRAMNLGYLTVGYSNFTNNFASNGQAISGITETIDYCNCENCTCPNCPNCENCTHYISNESANLKLYNNIYLNHTGTSDTVTISGNEYIFNYIIFINSTQNTVYNGTGNKYNLTDYPNPLFAQSLLKSNLGSAALADSQKHDVIYVNVSSDQLPFLPTVDGQSWENAYGGEPGFFFALNNINNNGIIYLAEGTYTNSGSGSIYNITIIGMNREQTIFDTNGFSALGDAPYENSHSVTTYINMTFKNPSVLLRNDQVFINCTFISPIIQTNEDIYTTWRDSHNADNIDGSFYVNFTDCEFKDYNIEGSLLEAFRYSQINFNNCVFDNVTANSIVNNTGGFTLQDAINFVDCTFTNVNVKGLVDVPEGTITGIDEGSRVYIENCDINAGTFTEDGRTYVNSTSQKTASEISAEIDDDYNIVITLKDNAGNALADVNEILIQVNDEEAFPAQLENGAVSKKITDITQSKKGNIIITFEGSSAYKGATLTKEFVIRNATIISAEDLTTEVNVAKDLTVTLNDVNGDPLVGKEIIVSVGGINSTVTTGEGGVATIPISYDTDGVYEYTLYFSGDADTYKEATKVVTVTVTKAPEPVTPTKVATKLTAAKVTATYNVAKKLVITLKDANGKALANKKVTVKVGTISKTLTTNAKGQVSINVATLVPKTYTATVKFAGDSSYSASTLSPKVVVSKAKVKLAAKDKTFKVKVKTKKYIVTLKNNKGKVMKKVKLTLKVGKKTYKATTNAKGKATFKITKLTKKGKYTATVKFAGNKYFKALSKKVKITVKK